MTMARITIPAPASRLAALLMPGHAGRYRLGVLVRVVAAVPGGYALAALAAMLLSVTLPMVRVEAVLAATMASFTVYAAAIVWAFAARSALRACAGIALPAAVLYLALLLRGTGA
jgi:hypothetical protein